jgi:D-arabinan exo alpha-(1,3)/(1,5)-arabinofuranosidase (non-reducing end)
MIVAKHIHLLKTYVTIYLRYGCLLVIFLCKPASLQAQRLPVIPAGADAYRMWDKWPAQRFGMRTYMRSTYDRTGGNDAADASHYLFMNGETDNVTLDVTGTGILYFFRTNHWHGSPWRFTTDGQEHLVRETATEDPVNAIRDIKTSVFIPATPFPRPLAWTWGDTKGADLIWTPIPFRQSLRIAYSRTHYGTGYYIYQLFANPVNLSQRIGSWNMDKAPDKDVVDLLSKAGQDIAPVHIPTRRGSVQRIYAQPLL